MIRKTNRTRYSGIITVFCAALTLASPLFAKDSHPGVKQEYNKVRDATIIMTKPVRIPQRIYFTAGYAFAGKTPTHPEKAVLVFTAVRYLNRGNAFADRLRWKNVDEIYMHYGDTKLKLPATYEEDEVNSEGLQTLSEAMSGSRAYKEELTVTIPLNTLLEMGHSKEVLIEIANADSKISGKALSNLQELIKTIPAP